MVELRKGTVHKPAPFPLDRYFDNTNGNYDDLRGMEFDGPEGDVFRLVQLNKTGGFAAANKMFKYTTASTYDVEPVSGATDRVCGVGNPALGATTTVDDNAVFFVQVEGRTQLHYGDDGNAISAADQVGPDNDADLGKTKKNTAAYVDGVTEFTALEAAAVDGDLFDAQIKNKLIG